MSNSQKMNMTFWSTIWKLRGFKKKDFNSGIVGFKKIFNIIAIGGEPITGEKEKFWLNINQWSKNNNFTVMGYHFSKEGLPDHKRWKFIKLGGMRIVDLFQFDIKGKKAKDWRRAKNKGTKCNWSVNQNKNLNQNEFCEFKKLENNWLNNKKLFPLGFLVGKLSDTQLKEQVFWQCRNESNSLQCYISVIEDLKNKTVYLDQMVKGDKSSKLSMDFLIVSVLNYYKSKEFQTFYLGLSPFYELNFNFNTEGMLKLFAYLIYPFYNWKSLDQYKRKFSKIINPQYILFDSEKSILFQIIALGYFTFIDKK